MRVTLRLERPGSELGVVARDLGQLPKEFRRLVRPKLRRAGEATRATAAANASWSSRIPGALTVSTSLGDVPGVTITASTAVAPHARAFEGMVRKSFRHPVYERDGRRTAWVEQAARPYLVPAVQENAADARRLAEEAVDEAFTAAGFK